MHQDFEVAARCPGPFSPVTGAQASLIQRAVAEFYGSHPMAVTYPKTDELLVAINAWTRPLVEHSAFRRLARSKIGSASDWESDWPTKGERIREVILPEPLAAQHDAVMQFYNLWATAERMRTVEFYFRRYPFGDLPINRHEHLENVCTLFFSYFYLFQERLRLYLNALNKASCPSSINVGGVLKIYQKRFSAELRERHSATHSEPFDDLTINAVMLRSLSDHDGPTGDRVGATYAYRKASREWAGHAKLGSERVAAFLEPIAGATLQVAIFLRSPPSLAPDDLKVR